jgi:TM2 domain-containing membrane protein YozV
MHMHCSTMSRLALPKTMLRAHLAWLLLGVAGGHHFYLGDAARGAPMLALFLLALVVPGWTGLALLAAPFLWAAVDLFRLPALVRARNAARAR